jgi:NAD-dependent deacetylase
MKTSISKIASEIITAKKVIALTGAGISVESGIAPFRGKGGLWEKYNPEEYAHIISFLTNPEKSWIMLKEMGEQIIKAKPNPAHYSLTRLEKIGKLDRIITQNVDNLHQQAGSKIVIEFHGNYKKLVCLECKNQYPFEKTKIKNIPPVPKCDCGMILKPNVILYGETPPYQAMIESEKEANNCDVMLIIGTSAIVYPAANLPYKAYNNNASIIEINIEPSNFTSEISKYFIKGKASEALSEIVKIVENNVK